MKKLINSADTVLEESLDGLAAHVETGQGRVDFGWRFGT